MNDGDYTFGAVRQIGDMLRDWRLRRRLSRRELADAAGLSRRILAAIETGRHLPSRDAVLRLTEMLDMPLRERNAMLAAAGHEAAFSHRPPGAPSVTAIWDLVRMAVTNHTPFPALAIDRHWGIVSSNVALDHLVVGVDPALMSAPTNWARIMLHPAGLAPRIANLHDWRAHVSNRLRRQFDVTRDTKVSDLLEEIADYPASSASTVGQTGDWAAVPLRLVTVDGMLCFHGATTAFSSAVDVTLAEVTIEAFYPADEPTAAIMREQPAAAG